MKKYISSPRLLAYRIVLIFPKLIKSDALYLKLKYYVNFRKTLNLENPKTFNEKIQWLKLHDRRPEYTTMVDKVEAKKYVASVIGEDHIIPTLTVYERAEDIDFDALPNQFVLKCSHDSGGIVICTDKSKLDREAAVRKLSKGLKSNYFYQTREWPYRNVKPKVLAEQYMSDDGENGLTDYKVHNFNGTPGMILVCRDRFGEGGMTEDFYNAQWEHLDISRTAHPNASTTVGKPAELDEMLRLSRELSKDIPFVRTDFYTVGHKVYFGELTFYPASGMKPFVPDEWDYKVGTMLQLSVDNQHN